MVETADGAAVQDRELLISSHSFGTDGDRRQRGGERNEGTQNGESSGVRSGSSERELA